ncbi:uncharacterized protein LOC135337855 isoform X2 [Halichondria panicea]|uniref:uncharacterized protein LOC135337855 isoform X2 n=1 Tax=Halichondria panicea TaxID=6063 RepID=UPI00312B4E6A
MANSPDTRLKLRVRYTQHPPAQFLEEFKKFVALHPGVILDEIDSAPSEEVDQGSDGCKASGGEVPPPTKKPKRGVSRVKHIGPGGEAGPSRPKKGYDQSDPPVLDGEGACPYCHLSPCVRARPPSWLIGSAAPNLGNMVKRYKLYRKYYTLLGHLGVWNHPLYMAYKATKTSGKDVLPDCVLTEVRGRFPNPTNVPYRSVQPSCPFIV